MERQKCSLLRRLRIAEATGRPWKEELSRYLLAYRTTPHTVTGISPAELMLNWKIKLKLPDVTLLETFHRDEDIQDLDCFRKDKKRHVKESQIEVGDEVWFGRRNKIN